MKEYFKDELIFLDGLKERFPDLADGFKSFLESPYIPLEMNLALNLDDNGRPSEESLSVVGNVALNNFISHYFKAVNHLAQELSPDKDWVYLKQEEPFFEWLYNEGLSYFDNVQKRLRISSVDTLCSVVRELDYLGAFLIDYEENTIDLLSTFYDLPIWLNNELAACSSLVETREWEPVLKVIQRKLVKYDSGIELSTNVESGSRLMHYSSSVETSRSRRQDLVMEENHDGHRKGNRPSTPAA